MIMRQAKQKKTRGLGKGINAIIGSDQVDDILEGPVKEKGERTIEIPLDQIEPNPFQPRELFDEEAIQGLSESLNSIGLIYPILVQKHQKKYHIIAGERRYRAARSIGWKKIPAIIRDVSEIENLTIALIENLQRENLNPIEEAKAYKLLLQKMKLKQNDLASQIGKDRTTITNTLRLLNLPDIVQASLVQGKISNGHARALLPLSDKTAQLETLKEITSKGLSVRQVEKSVKNFLEGKNKEKGKEKINKGKDAQIKLLESELRERLGTKVQISHKGQKGRVEIYFYSLDEFDRIREMLNSG